ncbi:MAG: hypothetical protein JSV46_06135 [Candidatus Aminicenantes bacterium]|nr:MAG: hypothetical protein JSV46_06135 [Candidatus Aminicenantes bacterium]
MIKKRERSLLKEYETKPHLKEAGIVTGVKVGYLDDEACSQWNCPQKGAYPLF